MITFWNSIYTFTRNERNVRSEYRIRIAFKFVTHFGGNATKPVCFHMITRGVARFNSYAPCVYLRRRHGEEFSFNKFVTM